MVVGSNPTGPTNIERKEMKTIEQLETEYVAAEAAYRWWSDVEEGAWESADAAWDARAAARSAASDVEEGAWESTDAAWRAARAVWDDARERADAVEIAALDAREALEKAKSCK